MKQIQRELGKIAKMMKADDLDTKKIKKSLDEVKMFSENANDYFKKLEKALKKGDYEKVAGFAYDIYDAMDVILVSAKIALKEGKRLEKEGNKREF